MINDWNMCMSFGPYKNTMLKHLPLDYIIPESKERDALIRIKNRRSVTKLLGKVNFHIPFQSFEKVLPSISRSSGLDPALFGSFIEYLVKYSIGLNMNDKIDELLYQYGLITQLPSHLINLRI